MTVEKISEKEMIPERFSLVVWQWYLKWRGLLLGKGAKVYPFVLIDRPRNVSFGKNTIVYPFVYVMSQNPNGWLQVGENCEINSFSTLLCGNGVQIGNYVLLSPGVKIISSTNYYKPNWLIASNPHVGGKVIIEDNVHIGTNAVILPNVRIGSGSIIGAGSIVTESVPNDTIAYGVPCRTHKKREEKILRS